jgi:class 3 adenylate cyclase
VRRVVRVRVRRRIYAALKTCLLVIGERGYVAKDSTTKTVFQERGDRKQTSVRGATLRNPLSAGNETRLERTMNLFENFRDPNLRVGKAVTFVDIVDSTGMKEREPEAGWLTTFGYVYDVIREVVERGEVGLLVKYTGDGALLAYNEDFATHAINDAIQIQQTIKDSVERRQVTVNVSVGIAIGEVVEFETSHGTDYLGTVVDRAARLCSIASAGAIFVDTATTASAQMNRVRSTVGEALGRKTDEYQGPVERASVPGFPAPVEYHEIKWDQQLFGVKSKVVTAAIESRPTPAVTVPARTVPTTGTATTNGTSKRAVRGAVQTWDDEKGRGRIIGPEDEPFYIDSRFLVGDSGLERDDIVYFTPFGPTEPGRNRMATATVYMGQEADATIVGMRDEGYGFVQVIDSRNHTQDIFFSMTDAPKGIVLGEVVTCVIVETARGVRAEAIEPRPPTAKAA